MIPRQYRIHVVLMIAAAMMIIIPLMSETPDEDKAKLATAAAEEFLARIDQDQFEEAWRASGELMKGQVSLEEWRENLEKTRAVIGALEQREQDDISFATMAKDSPEGEYIQIFYDSRYTRQPSVEEIVTTMLQDGGQWKVVGYFVR